METELIISELKSVADQKRKEAYKIMFPTTMEYLGVRTPAMRELLKKWWIEIKEWPPEELIEFSKNLVDTKVFEANQVAFELLTKNKNAYEQLSLADLEYLGKNMDNWATTDTFSILISGKAWKNNQISDENVLNWLHSKNRWWRRTAIVSTIPLNRGKNDGTENINRALSFCEKVVNDRDDMVVKALSWALRELTKSDKKAVKDFMNTYRDKLAGRVVREVNNKLITGKKS